MQTQSRMVPAGIGILAILVGIPLLAVEAHAAGKGAAAAP